MPRTALIACCILLIAIAAGLPAATASRWYQQIDATLQTQGLPAGEWVWANEQAATKAFRLYGQQVGHAELRTIEPPADPPVATAHQIEIQRPTQHYWSVVYGAQGPHAVAKGDAMLLVAAIRSGGSREANAVSFRMEVKADGKGRFATDRGAVTPTPEWRTYLMPIRIERPAAAGEWKLELFMGGPTQVLEIGGLGLLRFGEGVAFDDLPQTVVDYDYAGRSAGYDDDLPWLRAARERIERHRKGDLQVEVVDATGQPVTGAEVHVAMQAHAFRFGSVLDTGVTNTAGDASSRYLELFDELFNTATIGTFKWGPWRGRWPGPTKPQDTLATVAWAHEHGKWVHGHTPVWHQYGPMPFKPGRETPQQVRDGILTWLDELLTIPQVQQQVDSWDAINHPFAFSQVWRDYGAALELPHGGRELHLEELARFPQHVPQHEIWVNEGGIMPRGGSQLQPYAEWLQWLMANDAPLHGAGFMCHFDASDLTPPEELYRRLELFAALDEAHGGYDLKLQVTEWDVSATWDDPAQVAVQADYTRDFLVTCFSHPDMAALIAWGFWQGRMWKANAAWYTDDWQLRPNGAAYRELVFDRWWTDERRVSDAAGGVDLRGFLGDYLITVEHAGASVEQRVSLARDGAEIQVTIGE